MALVSEWTDQRVEDLRKLFADGFSASQIAAQLGFLTRNAVIGKLSRLGLKRGKPVPRIEAARAPRKMGRPRKTRVESIMPSYKQVTRIVGGRIMDVVEFDNSNLRQAVVISLNISLIDLEHGQCKYPTSDAPTLFCGTEQEVHSSYCPQHAELCRGALRPRTGKVLPFAEQKKPMRSFAGAWL